jgi:UDP-4-amino-4,6-dideoxy-N-acetyl-beta-L-altrosamine transaminase
MIMLKKLEKFEPVIPYGRQDISEADIQEVVKVLRSDFLTQGPMVPRFEKCIASFCDARFGVAVNSATSALHIACMALEIGLGDIVWTTPISFVASANCALYCGATIDFVDIDPRSYNMCANRLQEKLVVAEKHGVLPKVVIAVHLCGQSCDMKEIKRLGVKYGFKIIEDASHAIGGKYLGQLVGSCRFSDITIFSFHPVKIVTTAEGGMAMTNCPNLAKKLQLLRSHGISKEFTNSELDILGPWYYEQTLLGYNYRMTDLQAALGISQMSRVVEFVSARHDISDRYDSELSAMSMVLPWQAPDTYSALHLYVIRLKLKDLPKSHVAIFKELRDAGIGVNLHYIPIYRQPYYRDLGFEKGYCSEAEKYYSEAISIPMFAKFTEAQQDKVIKSLQRVVG